MQGFARNDKGDGQQDQADTRSKPRSEQFTEDRHADHHCRQRLQSPHNSGRSRTDGMHGNGHQHQRNDRRNQSQHRRPPPHRGCREKLQRLVGTTQRIQHDRSHAEQQHVKRKLHRRHIQRSTVDHHDIERIRERRSHDQHNARSIEHRTALTPVQQRDSAQSQGNGEDRDQRNSLPEENRHDDGHHDRIDEKKGGGDPRIHIVKTHEQRERRYGEHHSQQSQHGELPARNAQRSFLHQQQGCQQYGGKRIAVKQHGIGVYSRPVE